MSCSFWNMRRRLKAQQQQKDKVITNIAAAQATEKVVISKMETATTAEEKAVTANDKRTGRKPKSRNTNK